MDLNEDVYVESTSPFDDLPDELVLKIFHIFIGNHRLPANKQTYDVDELILPHDILLNTIAKVSNRFKRISSDKSLWSGRVVISGDDEHHVKKVIYEFLDKNALALDIYREDESIIDLSSRDFSVLAWKCPNMEYVKQIWPHHNVIRR